MIPIGQAEYTPGPDQKERRFDFSRKLEIQENQKFFGTVPTLLHTGTVL